MKYQTPERQEIRSSSKAVDLKALIQLQDNPINY